ncbi:MAG: MarR family transcriptional regulator [Propionibacteriaceae bacterium]|jgi:DNA-binding MarR family transcriptional regulator|nr:MarR family transcriptional regulator [Propionibacteriaceae bacterium]
MTQTASLSLADFETGLNDLLVDTFDTILKYETSALKTLLGTTLTIGEAHMIDCIARLGEKVKVTVSQIATQMQIAVPTATIAIKKMEQKGYILKKPSDTDGRSVWIELTESGKLIDRAHTIFHQRMVRNVSSQFAPEERSLLLEVISRLNQFFVRETQAVQ